MESGSAQPGLGEESEVDVLELLKDLIFQRFLSSSKRVFVFDFRYLSHYFIGGNHHVYHQGSFHISSLF